jgi:hypothetical protein
MGKRRWHGDTTKPRNNPPRATGHARERMREYGLTWAALIDEIAADAVRVTPGSEPRQGKPIHIGTQKARPSSPSRKEVRLCSVRGGRRIHVVTTIPREAEPRDVVTLWDPEADENKGYWQEHLLAPTRAGINELPPTTWFLPIRNVR